MGLSLVVMSLISSRWPSFGGTESRIPPRSITQSGNSCECVFFVVPVKWAWLIDQKCFADDRRVGTRWSGQLRFGHYFKPALRSPYPSAFVPG